MKKPDNRFLLSPVCLALIAGFTATPVLAQEQEDEEYEAIEEVVATATRLKGTATAVLEERKNQAFVADILGAEQISRTGDGDAAAALRRVTGLTLVDGKFIYVRGLGERYSSTQLNGFTIPSPDPTRNVIPLDLFPSQIIESLSVQKSYSPSMPAGFGGGNVDVRLKSIPNDFVFNVSGGVGSNSENLDDGLRYNTGSGSWKGRDDGTRAMPQALADVFNSRKTIEDLSIEEQQEVALSLNRDYDPRLESIDPDMNFNATIGNYINLDEDWKVGFLASMGYSNAWQNVEEVQANQFARITDGVRLQAGWPEGSSTEHTVQWSGMVNLGVQYTNYHKIDINLLMLNDTRDQMRERFGYDANTSISDGFFLRSYDVIYEERLLKTGQIRGSHTFEEYNFLSVDWKYSESNTFRRAPGNITTGFLFTDANGDGIFDRGQEDISLLGSRTGQVDYTFQRLDDIGKNYGFDVSYPFVMENWDIELKAGVEYTQKARVGTNRTIGFLSNSFSADQLVGFNLNDILTDDLIRNFNSPTNQNLLRQSTAPGDDYKSAQVIDAGYFEFDLFYDNQWRLSGGLRFEDFKQIVLDSSLRDGTTGNNRNYDDIMFQDSEVYPALALTYIYSDEMQFRFSYGETVVRPDLREISDALYIDPLTEFPVQGTPGLIPTQIKHYDFRWEWYLDNGDNLSAALFYKDMADPIESFATVTGDGAPITRIANGESGEIVGLEVEFLKGLEFLGSDSMTFWNDLFVSGNLTISDSETTFNVANITEQTGINTDITNLSRRLTGHSEWVVNLQAGYDSPNGEHSASLVYNVFGERIIIPGIAGLDDAFEQPFHSLDFVYTHYPDFNTTIRFSVQNLLNDEKEIFLENGLQRFETPGVGFSLSYQYQF